MNVTYKSRGYDPSMVRRRYVRYDAIQDYFFYIEVGDDARYDLLQAIVSAEDLPEEIKQKAIALQGRAFGYVEWK